MIKFIIDSAICRLRYPYLVLRNKLLKRMDPIIVILVVNNQCNLKCSYCFGDYCGRKGYKDFTTQELIDIIDQSYVLGVRILTIHGGETLLRQDIGEIVNYIKDKKMYLNLITNGLLLKDKIDLIRRIDSLCISLDGNEEGHDKNRGKGTFRPTIEAIKFAKKEGFRLRVHATITKHTKGDIEFLAKLAKEIGYSQEFSILYHCGVANKNLTELMLTDEDTKNVIREIMFWKSKSYPIYTAYDVLNNVLNWPYSYNKTRLTKGDLNKLPFGFKPIPCFNGKTKFSIDADGYVYPCFAHLDEFKALNVREVSVKKAIDYARDNNPCRGCIHITNNDHNLLLAFSLRHVLHQCKLQLIELLGIY